MQKELSYYSKCYQSKIIAKTLCQTVSVGGKNVYLRIRQGSVDKLCGSGEQLPTDAAAGILRGMGVSSPGRFQDNDVRGLLKGLDKVGKTEVLHKGTAKGMTDDAFLLSLSSLCGHLTEKQMKALLSAIENGYYEIPKKTTADELAVQTMARSKNTRIQLSSQQRNRD